MFKRIIPQIYHKYGIKQNKAARKDDLVYNMIQAGAYSASTISIFSIYTAKPEGFSILRKPASTAEKS